MKPNTCFVVDVWEGQLEIDEAALKAGGVAGMSIRINDMNGGHHKDAGFEKQWREAIGFVRFPYFVYNPWVNGKANYDWLVANMPNDAKSVAIDIEVKYANYPPATYAGEVNKFLELCKPLWKTIIYTAEWFLPCLSKWPAVDYWWAQYPNGETYFNQCVDWETVSRNVERLSKPFNVLKIPGNLKMWQFSGDFLTLPGSTRKMDVNLFYGSADDLAAYFGSGGVGGGVEIPAEPEPVPAPVTAESFGWLKPRFVAGGPAIIAGSDAPAANHPTIALGAVEQAWIKSLNHFDSEVWRLFEAANVGPTKGINDNGKLIYIMAGWSGNLVKILERRAGWVKVDSLSLAKSLPDGQAVNHEKTPWLVHRMTTVSAAGKFVTFPARGNGSASQWDSLDDPLISVAGEFWLPAEWVAEFATMNRYVNVRSGPGTTFAVVGGLSGGTRVNVRGVATDGVENLWSQIGAGKWCCLRYYGTAYSDWVFK